MIDTFSQPSSTPRTPPPQVAKETVLRFQAASTRKAVWQLINSVTPYLALWFVMFQALAVSYWLMLPVAVVAAGFLVRIFIIFHDCGHGSFLQSKRGNHVVGIAAGLLNLTPFRHWRWQHALHHGTAGDLDRRGSGDIWTLTVAEYKASKRASRLKYRLARSPVILFLVAPLYVFAVHHRIAASDAPRRERNSVLWTNLALLATVVAMSGLIGLKEFLAIQLTVSALAGAAGLWLFYVQHQFDGAYWSRGRDWSYVDAALQGSSFYKLPKVLQWFTGNIGFHHVHHLSPRIANYHLEQCHNADPLLASVKPLSLLKSLKCASYRLWDEERQRYVSFRHLQMLA